MRNQIKINICMEFFLQLPYIVIKDHVQIYSIIYNRAHGCFPNITSHSNDKAILINRIMVSFVMV